ncbi:hypothetical protein MJO29_004533, partial [Puccinia striiformis f. sp. tritici]
HNDQQQEQETIAEGSSNQKTGQNVKKKEKSGGICKHTDIWRGIYLDLDKEDEIISKFDLENLLNSKGLKTNQNLIELDPMRNSCSIGLDSGKRGTKMINTDRDTQTIIYFYLHQSNNSFYLF